MNPDIDEDSIEKVIRETIQKKIQNPVVTLDNNYTHESRETNLLSVLNWVEGKKPIICGNAAFYKNQNDFNQPNFVLNTL